MKGTSQTKRYRIAPKSKEKPFSDGFVIRSIRQTVTCALLFLICLPLSASDNPVRPYIARVLVASSDIGAARLSATELWRALEEKIPALAKSKDWGKLTGFFVADKPSPEEETASEDLEIIAQASPQEFTLPDKVDFIMPYKGRITSAYGERGHPVSGEETIHYGIDIGGKVGDTVVSAAPGRVVEVKVHDIYGNCILIEHTPTLKTFYAHLDKVDVSQGDIVGTNTKIGEIGTTGVTTGPHLHFGMRENDKPIDPQKYIKIK